MRTRRLGAVLVAAKRAVLLALVWLALTAGDPKGLVIGVLAVAAATALSLRLLPPAGPVRLWRLGLMLPGFLWRSVLGGVDVVWRACHPLMPLRPGWILLPTGLTGGGRAALGGELSLMPGTLVAGSRDGALLVHVLDRDQDLAPALQREAARLDRAIGREALGSSPGGAER